VTATTDARTRLRRLGQVDLGAWISVAEGSELWTVQKQIASAVSERNARVVVPSCVASGKTFLAARLALAFYDAYQPGTPCDICNGPCGGAKVMTTSSKWEHLKDNLWGEIRMAVPRIRDRVGLDGNLPPSDLWIDHTPQHFIHGMVATKPEGFQGYHAAHILVIGDEATSVSEEVAQGITGVLSTGDARLLLILNPTDTTTYAYRQSKAPRTKVIRIRAQDTPGFTGEDSPAGAHLITPQFLEDLKEQGMGPGTYEWTTRVCAEFWDLSEDTLVAEPWYDAATGSRRIPVPGMRALGIDLASYGTAESVLAVKDGNALTDLLAFPSQRTDHFFQGPVTQAVQKYQPHYVIYDADGVGAGAIGYAEALYRHLPPGAQVIGFRGAKKINDAYTNARSAWYWHLRRLFESDEIAVMVNDPRLREQLTQIRYSISSGAIRLETKEEMRKRGMASPDRADAVMYAFAFSGQLSMPVVRKDEWVATTANVRDNSDRAMWERDLRALDFRREEPEIHDLLGVSDW
jgi:phage terminase large subunit